MICDASALFIFAAVMARYKDDGGGGLEPHYIKAREERPRGSIQSLAERGAVTKRSRSM